MEKREKKYEFAIHSLPKFLQGTFYISVVIALLSALILAINDWFYFIDAPIVFYFIGGLVLCIVLSILILFMSIKMLLYTFTANDELENNCIICLESITLKEKYILCPKCLKPMHYDEGEDWLKDHPFCPNCKRNFKKISIKSKVIVSG